jgi:nucleotide-binding universal stress UspA family protein
VAWQPIVIGVDGSPESVRAAVFGSGLAAAAGAPCVLAHAALDYWSATSMHGVAVDAAALDAATRDQARTLVQSALVGLVPEPLLHDMVIRTGPAAAVLTQVAREREAQCIVLGGKHRRGIARLAGSTVTNLVRLSDIPVIATDGGSGGIQRVLAAVDLSHAAAPTIEAAERMAALFAADLRVLHVVEPLPLMPAIPLDVSDDDMYRAVERQVTAAVWPLVTAPRAEKIIRRGRTAAAIVDEALQWRADLLVLGSHGKGWVDRIILGSTSERLLQMLPAVTMVVPAHAPVDHPGAGAGLSAHARA